MPMPKRKPNYNGTTTMQELLTAVCEFYGEPVDYRKEEDLDSEIVSLIEERQAARKRKDFAEADRIRDELKSRGIELLDTREGVKWKRI